MLLELSVLVFTDILALLVGLIAAFSVTLPGRLRASLIVTVLGLALWQTTVYLTNRVFIEDIFWYNLTFLWPTVATVGFALFLRFLTSHNKWLRKDQSVGDLTTVALMIVGTAFQLFALIKADIYVAEGENALIRGDGYAIYIIGLLLMLLAIFITLLVSSFDRRKSIKERRAVRIILYTVTVAILYGLSANVILPLVTGTQDFAALGILTTGIFAVGFVYSVVNARLLNVKLYAVRSVAYLLSIATLTLMYGALALLISTLIIGYETNTVQNIVNIGLALLLAFLFQPIRRFFDKATNRIFFRDAYDSDVFYSSLNKRLSSTNDLRHLMNDVSTYIAQTVNAEHALFAIYTATSMTTEGTKGYPPLPMKDARHLDEHFKTEHRAIVLSQIDERDRSLRRLLVSHKIDLVLPLIQDEAIIGYLLLGEQRTGGYSRRDVKLLETIADELVIAIQNSLAVLKIKDLNDHLEQRIASATRELRHSNAQLQRLDEAKDEFISMASHQLRTPLTSIKGYISMMMEGDIGAVSSEQKHVLNEAFVSSERMVRLISDFLNVSRLQTGKFTLERQPVDLARLVEREIEGLEPNATARDLKFRYVKPRGIPKVTVDENKIQQVIMNFADNAIYYSKEQSTIKVTLKQEKRAVVFTVKDTGIGVPVAEQEHLFNKFFRATNARRQRPDGTGVGLFLAKKVIDAHKGEILFESTEGKGSTFGFRLPLD